MDFSFLTPDIIVKHGAAEGIGSICAKYMRRVGVFRYGAHFEASGARDMVERSLRGAGLEVFFFGPVPGEPSSGVVDSAAAFLAENGCDGGLAVGGGSVIDVAKAACALAANGTDIMEYVEGFGGKPFQNEPLPVVAVPTTAGTGSECTKNSVITNKGSFKNSVRADGMLPKAAVIDARLMADVPRKVTAEAGADCVCHLWESYATRLANPFSDALALRFAQMAFDALPRAYADGQDMDAREQMGLAACAAGMAMGNSGLGMAHGIAAGMGAMTPITHGLVCGVALPYVMRFNIRKGVLEKYANLARTLGGKAYANDREAAEDAARMTEELLASVGIPKDFKSYGFGEEDIKKIAAASMGSSMGKNPVEVSLGECEAVLREML